MPQLQLRPTGIIQPGRVTQPTRSTGKVGLPVQTASPDNLDKTSPGQKQRIGVEEAPGSCIAAVGPLWSTLAGEQLGTLSRELADLRQEVFSLKKGASCGLQLKGASPGIVVPRTPEPASQPSDQLAQLTRELVSLRQDVDSVQQACSKCDADVKQATELASKGGSTESKPTNEKLAAVLGEFDRTMKSWLQRRLDEQAREHERREGEQRTSWQEALELRTQSLESSIRKIEDKFTGEVQQLAAEHKTADTVMRDVFVEQCSGVEKSMAKSSFEIRQETRRALDEFDVRLRGQSTPLSDDCISADSRSLWRSDLQTVVEAMAQLEHEQESKHASLRSTLQELDTALRDEIRQSLESHHEVQADAIQQAMNQLVRNLNGAFSTYKTENQAQIDRAVDELAKAKLGFQQMREPSAPEVLGGDVVPAAASPAASLTMPQSPNLRGVERQMPTGGGAPTLSGTSSITLEPGRSFSTVPLPTGGGPPSLSGSLTLEPGRSSPTIPLRSPPAAVATFGPGQLSPLSSVAEVQAQLRGASRANWSGQRSQSLRSAQPG